MIKRAPFLHNPCLDLSIALPLIGVDHFYLGVVMCNGYVSLVLFELMRDVNKIISTCISIPLAIGAITLFYTVIAFGHAVIHAIKSHQPT